MNSCVSEFENKSLGEIVSKKPWAALVFEEFKLDYCCGGKQSLLEACQKAELDTHLVTEKIQEQEGQANNWDCPKESLTELCDHIEEAHHRHLENLLPELEHLIQKVAHAHGDNHPFLHELLFVFQGLHVELMQHMGKEEQILFPFCKIIETSTEAQSFHCGSVANPIRVMCMDHDNAGEVLREIRQLTSNYEIPDDVCTTYRIMMEELQAFELDMKQHIHKENNVLYPMALKAEASLH
ncbi:iron-sulfur cluster repair di-iron protein [Lentisphaera profundi]|uniref:Iron-sulfur cluster repair di-iron protein n=1 Tax=Lentisphaera profundi TaxID=1658616 RepID=A0ABY7VPY8_9BACT|nr:iron-sulfur cluster repair di-iron protein [Lentisphaera profundi]WDE96245.1 iron-sulfur cluster repair di-iron protein [Lentisphaera profundi]